MPYVLCVVKMSSRCDVRLCFTEGRDIGYRFYYHITHLPQQCHNSKPVTFQDRHLKLLKCYNFLWVQRRHNCSPAASFTNCVMTLHLSKVHLQTFLSIPITKKCQILSCDTLVANGRYDCSYMISFLYFVIHTVCKWMLYAAETRSCLGFATIKFVFRRITCLLLGAVVWTNLKVHLEQCFPFFPPCRKP